MVQNAPSLCGTRVVTKVYTITIKCVHAPCILKKNSIARNEQEIDAHEQIRLVHITDIARNGPDILFRLFHKEVCDTLSAQFHNFNSVTL
jgi:hypothetical protein